MKIDIEFLETRKTMGDYETYIFRINSQNRRNIIVNVSGSLIALKKNFIPVQIAAKVIDFHLRGLVPLDCYSKNESSIEINISSSWYPGFPSEPLIHENHNNFKVEIPKKRLGFDLN